MKLKEKHFYVLGAISLILASIFSVGFYHADEHFQILEFAGYKLGLCTAADLAWEFHYQMRPTFQPAIAVISHYFWGWFGLDNPFFISFFLRFLSAGLTFLSIWLLYSIYKDKIKDATLKRWYLTLTFLLWFVIYNGVRFSSESWGGALFVIGFSSYFLFRTRGFISYVFMGAILGGSFLCRYQVAFLILGFGLWLAFIKKERFKNMLYMSIGTLALVLIGIIIDKWFYGEWTLSTWNYFSQNIVHDKVSTFGIIPWWGYFSFAFLKAIPPFSLLFIAGTLVFAFFQRKSPITWSIVPFIIIHSVIGHKELRFLFPIIGFMPIVVILGITSIQERYYPLLMGNRYFKGFMKLFFVINFLALIYVVFSPADGETLLYKEVYFNSKKPTTLYCIHKNPYERALDIHYYKRKNLIIKNIQSKDEIPVNEKGLLAFQYRNKVKGSRLGKAIFSTYPEWILKLNINHWVERSGTWFLYPIATEGVAESPDNHQNDLASQKPAPPNRKEGYKDSQ